MPYKWYVPVTIAAGQSLSAVYDFGGGQNRMGVVMPAAWDVAGMTFQVSTTAGGTFANLYNEAGTEVSITVAQQKAYAFNTSVAYIAPFRWVKVRSGTSGTPVSQTAEAVLGFYFQR